GRFVRLEPDLEIHENLLLRRISDTGLRKPQGLLDLLAPMPVVVSRRDELEHGLSDFDIKRHKTVDSSYYDLRCCLKNAVARAQASLAASGRYTVLSVSRK